MAEADNLIAGVVEQRCTWEAALAEQGLTVPAHPLLERTLPGVWEASDYVAKSCIRYPEILPHLLASGRLERPHTQGEPDRLVAAVLAGVADDRSLAAALRRFRHREMVRIIWRDLATLAGLDETLEDLSALADTCVDHTLRLLHGWLAAEVGTPRDEAGAKQHLVVLGMGKLGARELNLSSDIDLIFAYTAGGRTDGPRPLTNEQFFVRLARNLIRVLDTKEADGFVFRVDARLRPFGDASPLAVSFGAMEDYYQSQAREWERYAMIRARVVAGDPESGERLMAMLRPFVYRRYLDFGAIESLRDMKRMIDREVERKGMADNIKLGPGGIREIEFIGQTFQLIRGGRDPDLQLRSIRSVLRRLGEKDLLSAGIAQQLGAAYEYLRLVENRLQAWKDQQTHRLPENAVGRLRLARSIGFSDWGGFSAVLTGHRRRVQNEFDRIFTSPHPGEEPREQSFATLWNELADGTHSLEQLTAAGFKDTRAVLERLRILQDTALRKGLSRRGGDRMARIIPLVLRLAADTHDPDLVLERVLRVLESVLSRTAYLAMLIEHPVVLSQLVQLAGMSPWFTERIGHHPLLLDELLDPRRLYAPLHRADLEQELDSLLAPLTDDDLEQQMERLHQFAQGNILRVAAADLTDVIPLMVVSDYLTEIAEAAVARVLALAYGHLRAKHGRPGGIADDGTGFLMLGYGKLGGIELGYGSDLDLVFVHGSDAVTAETRGERRISNEQFYLRLGQRMIHMLTTRTPSGQLYPVVDMRLRPDGDKGMLVRSLRSFAYYQTHNAWTWEHQALVRARPVAGDRALAERFGRIRREVLGREREPEGLRRDVRAMRERMRKHLDRTRQGWFDLKQGCGGIADIEFMVQYLVLRWAAQYPDLADWTDNVRLIETLACLDLLPGTVAEDLTDAYKALRAAYHRSALQEQPTRIPDHRLRGPREQVRTWWRELMED